MLTEICQELRNWFDRDRPKWFGQIRISDQAIFCDNAPVTLVEGQYYRIIGGLFNEGVHKAGDSEDVLKDEAAFDGAVWSMGVPQAVIDLDEKISDWLGLYGTELLKPYQSESFGSGGYSYSKGSGGSSSSNGGSDGWEAVFASELNRWRKI